MDEEDGTSAVPPVAEAHGDPADPDGPDGGDRPEDLEVREGRSAEKPGDCRWAR